MAARSILPVLAMRRNTSSIPRAGKHGDTQFCIRAIAPSVRNSFAKGRYITRLSVKNLVAVCEARSPFHNYDMFVFFFVNVQRCAIAPDSR